MYKPIFYFLICLLMACSVHGQEIRKVKTSDIIALADSCDQPLILNFWASWCAPCIHEIPWFESAIKEHADKNIRLILVCLDFPEESPARLQEFVKKNNYQSEIWWLSETNADSLYSKIDTRWQGSLPASLFINRKQHYRQFYSRQVTEPQLEIEIERMMEERQK